MPKKIVLHLISSLNSGGCENMLLRTLPLVAKFDHRVFTLKYPGELASRFDQAGIPVKNIDHLWNLLPEIHRLRPALIVTYLFHADVIGRLLVAPLTRYPVIPFLRTTYNHPRYLPARVFERLTSGFVPHYLANSPAVKNYYVTAYGISPEKITIVPTGIDVDYFRPDKNSRQSYRRQLGISPRDIVLICVANFHPNKGHRYLISAFSRLYKDNKNVRLLLVGDGQLLSHHNAQVKKLPLVDQVLFLGKRADVRGLLQASDIFVLPTLFEGLSNSLLEAMAVGLPVVTTAIPENKQLFGLPDYEFLVLPADDQKLFQAIKRLVDDRRHAGQVGLVLRRRAETAFNLQFTAVKMGQVFNRLISEKQ